MLPKVWPCFVALILISSNSKADLFGADNSSDEFVSMIVTLLGDSDREFRAAGLEQVRTAAKGAADYGVKIIELANVNTSTAFNFFGDLMNTTSLSEFIKLSTEHAHRNFNIVSAQNKELWELAQKVATETAEPIKQGFTKVLQKVT